MGRGFFVTFEGPEGSGKTTQFKLCVEFLGQAGVQFVSTREPGGTDVGERIREVLLSKRNAHLVDEAELFLFSAARSQLVQSVISPALREGKLVICDRYTDSTLAHQHFGLGLPRSAVETVVRLATGGLQPDLTLLFDLDVEIGLSRRREQEVNRIDLKELDYHFRVRSGYLKLVDEEPHRFVVIDALEGLEAVTERVREIFENRILPLVVR